MRILYSPLAATLITGIVGIICVSLYLNSTRIRSSALTVQKLETEVASIEAKVQSIENQAVMATSSTEKERLFREELLLQRPNEYIVQVPDLPLPSPKPIVSPPAVRPLEQWKALLL
jgi:hypothetical protein